MRIRDEIVCNARGCIGARFQPQGRDAASGLDCLGVVAVAYKGRLHANVPADYAQRGGDAATIGLALERAGFVPAAIDRVLSGDLLLLATAPAQWHFVVLTGDGFVHADARLRRVVEVPGLPSWPVAGAWRLAEEEG